MSAVSITLFGPPQIRAGGTASTFRRKRGLALLAYLATNPGPQPRDSLLALIWPEFSAEDARNNLRRDLSLLRKALPEGALDSDSATLTLDRQHPDLSIDVLEFERLLDAVRLHHQDGGELCAACAASLMQATTLYSHDFLDGFSLPDSSEFAHWSRTTGERLRYDLIQVLQQLMQYEASRGDYPNAIELGQRLLSLDPTDELTVRRLMDLYVAGGHRSAAIQQYEQLYVHLRAEYGIQPEEETRQLAQAIRDETAPPVEKEESKDPDDTTASPDRTYHHNLNRPPLPLVGRTREVEELSALLGLQETRLITLKGAGGVGKTRLALELAWNHVEHFPEGVYLIDLTPLTTPSEMIVALASSLGVSLKDVDNPREHVLRHVRNKRLLLLFDNFEHLLEAGSFLDDLAGASESLKLMTTSRLALHRQIEIVYPIHGLGWEAEVDAPRTSDAMELFVQRARQTDATFEPDKADMEHIEAIVRAVEGMPLAIELAATWVNSLTPAEIQSEIVGDINLLASPVRDLPDRQRSMTNTLEHSWRLLAAEERGVLSRLSLFAGGFTVDAAREVAGATLPVLRTLVAHSQISHNPDTGRYHMHELLRQFAREKLGALGDAEPAQMEYSRYFARWLSERQPAMSLEDEQLETLDKVDLEINNIRVGFLHAAETSAAHLTDYLPGLLEYHIRQYLAQPGSEIFEQALSLLPDPSDPISDALLLHYACLVQTMGMFRGLPPEREHILEQISHIRPDALTPYLRCLYHLSHLDLNLLREDVDEYDRQAQQALSAGEAANTPFFSLLSLYWTMESMDRRINRLTWNEFARRTRQSGDRYFSGVLLYFDALRHLNQGNISIAERQMNRCYVVSEESNDMVGIVMATFGLVKMSFWRHELNAGLEQIERASSVIEKYDLTTKLPGELGYRLQYMLALGAYAEAERISEQLQKLGPGSWILLDTGLGHWLAFVQGAPMPDPGPLQEALQEGTDPDVVVLPDNRRPDRLITRAMVELREGKPVAAATSLRAALSHPAVPPWYARQHPVVRLLIEELESTSLPADEDQSALPLYYAN